MWVGKETSTTKLSSTRRYEKWRKEKSCVFLTEVGCGLKMPMWERRKMRGMGWGYWGVLRCKEGQVVVYSQRKKERWDGRWFEQFTIAKEVGMEDTRQNELHRLFWKGRYTLWAHHPTFFMYRTPERRLHRNHHSSAVPHVGVLY